MLKDIKTGLQTAIIYSGLGASIFLVIGPALTAIDATAVVDFLTR